ncbi:hypothetical protein PSAC2689_40325 [Paraburkholderia sacchari]
MSCCGLLRRRNGAAALFGRAHDLRTLHSENVNKNRTHYAIPVWQTGGIFKEAMGMRNERVDAAGSLCCGFGVTGWAQGSWWTQVDSGRSGGAAPQVGALRLAGWGY